mmetsp:Transcript_1177/g.2127  ORF Transcript_1177/g.2127 Transcript_1177/m.2127 type:complete len:728 (+) Transcript_1177:126-2309(+)
MTTEHGQSKDDAVSTSPPQPCRGQTDAHDRTFLFNFKATYRDVESSHLATGQEDEQYVPVDRLKFQKDDDNVNAIKEDQQIDEASVVEELQSEISSERHAIKSDNIKRSFRWINVALVCICLIGSLLYPMEDKMRRRAQPRTSLDYGVHRFRKAIQRYLGNNGGNDNYNGNNQNNYYQNQQNVNDDVANADDLYRNDTYYKNETYYEEEYYTPKEDDFYVFVDDDYVEMRVFPLELRDYIGFTCASISVILSIGGGIGPGAILLSVYIIVMDFPPKVAIPLSSVTGLGINTYGNLVNSRKRHPLINRPIIDWDLILVIEPVILLGAIIGTYINKTLEAKTLIVLLVLLLSVIALNTLKKARRMHHAEELYIKRMLWAKQKRKNAQSSSCTSPVYPGSFENKLAEADPPFVPKIHSLDSPKSEGSNSPKRANNSMKSNLLDGSNHSRATDSTSQGSFAQSFNLFINLRKEDAESVKSSLLEEEADPLPQNKITYIITMFLVVIAVNVLKGGAAFESPLGVECGSVWFWLFEVLTASWLIICTFLAGKYLLRRHAIKEAVGFDYVRGDIKWDVRTIVIYPSACFMAGVVAGMFGIGVSVMVGPMLVGIGVNPAVAAATCGCMNFFTALAATSSYVVLGSIIPDREYAICLYILGAFSAWIGSYVAQKAKSATKIENNKRLERHSYMAYSMGLVVLVSALSMTVEAILDVINHSYDDDSLDGVCMEERIY